MKVVIEIDEDEVLNAIRSWVCRPAPTGHEEEGVVTLNEDGTATIEYLNV